MQTPFYAFSGFLNNAATLNHTLISQAYHQEQYLRFLHLRKHQYLFQRHILQEGNLFSNIPKALSSETQIFIRRGPCHMNPDFLSTFYKGDTINLSNIDFPQSFKSGVLSANGANISNSFLTERTLCKTENDLSTLINVGQKIQTSKEIKTLKKAILDILEFFVESSEKVSPNEIEKQKSKYDQNSCLAETFEILYKKYLKTTKCKEDMARLLLRKALTFMRNTLAEELKLNAKQASIALCKKCFMQSFKAEIEKMGDNILDFFLPYKKNSRNKTPNTRFIQEAFLSKDFLQGYMTFLSKFDEIIKTDNQKRMNKFVDFIYDCIIQQRIHKITEYKRLPWLDCWVEKMKIIAHELLDRNIVKQSIAKLN